MEPEGSLPPSQKPAMILSRAGSDSSSKPKSATLLLFGDLLRNNSFLLLHIGIVTIDWKSREHDMQICK
jgi:hypothetical protein